MSCWLVFNTLFQQFSWSISFLGSHFLFLGMAVLAEDVALSWLTRQSFVTRSKDFQFCGVGYFWSWFARKIKQIALTATDNILREIFRSFLKIYKLTRLLIACEGVQFLFTFSLVEYHFHTRFFIWYFISSWVPVCPTNSFTNPLKKVHRCCWKIGRSWYRLKTLIRRSYCPSFNDCPLKLLMLPSIYVTFCRLSNPQELSNSVPRSVNIDNIQAAGTVHTHRKSCIWEK